MAIDAPMQGLHFARPGISGGLTSGGVGPVASGVFLPNLFVFTSASELSKFESQVSVMVRLRVIIMVAAEHCPAGGLTSRRGAKLGLGLGDPSGVVLSLRSRDKPSRATRGNG